MAHQANFRYFDTKIDQNGIKEEIVDILLSLKPSWTKDDLCHHEYTDGYITRIIFYQRADEKQEDALEVRVYVCEGNGHGLPLERENEFLTMQVAHAAGCFPAIVGSFKNGVIYEYVPGMKMPHYDLVKPQVIKKLMWQLYCFHHIDPDSVDLYDRRGEPCKYNKAFKTVEVTLDMIKMIPSQTKNERNKEMFEKYRKEITDEYLLQEYEFVKTIHDDVKLPLALSHEDFHPRNIILNEKTGKSTFIEYELASFTYEAADLVRFFDNKEFCDVYGLSKSAEPDITDDIIKSMYLKEYINAKNEKDGKEGTVVSDEEIEILDTEMRIVKAFNLLTFMVVSLLFADISLNGVHFINSLGELKANYEAMKKELPLLRDRYLKLIAKND